MKYFSVLCIFVIFALAACYAAIAEPNQVPADADPAAASLAEKKTEKRGIYGFGYGHGGYGGYGGYYGGHGHAFGGYPHYGGYSALHHGYAAPYYGGHLGYYPNYHHGLYH